MSDEQGLRTKEPRPAGSYCKECGMNVESAYAYHPYAACLMFTQCSDAEVVKANLDAVVGYGRDAGYAAGYALGYSEARTTK